MTKGKNTKRALLTSVLSMLLCVAMLVGSTFAWFTDSVTSGKNKIVAGNLDVELYHTNGSASDEKVEADTKLFVNSDGSDILWEPGVMVYENFTVKNVGSLALKYRLKVDAVDFNTVKDTEKSLMDVLKVAILDEAFTGDRAAAQALTFDSTLADFEKNGNLAANAQDDTYAIVIYWEPSDVDNDYNLNNGKTSSDGNPLFIDLGVDLIATQDTVESDSFDNQYDKDAVYPPITEWFDPEATDYSIGSAQELAGLVNLVNEGNNFKGKTITLSKDIDLQNQTMAPIGSKANPFSGTFDGNGKTISNINPSETPEGYTGLFGMIQSATISNVTISGGTVASGKNYTGVIAGNANGGKLTKVTVDGVNVSGKDYTGGLLGNGFTAKVDDCVVKNSTISGEQYLGGVTGQTYSNMSNVLVENCKILGTDWKVGGVIGQLNEGNFTYNNLTVSSTVIQASSGSSFSGSCAGGLIGFTNYGNKTFNGCSVLNCTLQLEPNKTGTLYGAAGMIGQIYGQNGNVYNFNNCEVSGLKATAGDQNITGLGGYIGNGYWRGYAGTTFNFYSCFAEITEVTAAQKTDIGAYVGNGKDNTFDFSGVNGMTGIVEDAIGTKGANITVTGEETINPIPENPDENEFEDPFA